MISRGVLHRVIGRALTDARFRERLLRDPMEATDGYPFSEEERRLIASLRATSLDELSRKLAERLADREAVRDS